MSQSRLVFGCAVAETLAAVGYAIWLGLAVTAGHQGGWWLTISVAAFGWAATALWRQHLRARRGKKGGRAMSRSRTSDAQPGSWVHGRNVADPLPVRQVAEHVVGWKRARLFSFDDQIRIYGAVADAYHTRDTAICTNGWSPAVEEHNAPHPACYCGFHAVRSKELLAKAAAEYDTGFTLEVWLWGKVLAHRDGWRGEHQQVVAVRVDTECNIKGCPRRAVGVSDVALVVPLCADHIPSSATVYSPADIANALGVEVAWADTKGAFPWT